MGSTCAVMLLTTILTTTRTNVGEHWWMSDSGMQLFMRFPNSGERLRAHEFGLWHRTVRVRAPFDQMESLCSALRFRVPLGDSAHDLEVLR